MLGVLPCFQFSLTQTIVSFACWLVPSPTVIYIQDIVSLVEQTGSVLFPLQYHTDRQTVRYRGGHAKRLSREVPSHVIGFCSMLFSFPCIFQSNNSCRQCAVELHYRFTEKNRFEYPSTPCLPGVL